MLVYSWPHQYTKTRPINSIVTSCTFIYNRRRGIAVCSLPKHLIVCAESAAALHASERFPDDVGASSDDGIWSAIAAADSWHCSCIYGVPAAIITEPRRLIMRKTQHLRRRHQSAGELAHMQTGTRTSSEHSLLPCGCLVLLLSHRDLTVPHSPTRNMLVPELLSPMPYA